MREPLTEIARKAFITVQARCLSQGLDLFEELNRVGLLATEPRIREIQVSALENLFDRLDVVPIDQLMAGHTQGNSNPGTPAAMYVGVQHWIRSHIRRIAHD